MNWTSLTRIACSFVLALVTLLGVVYAYLVTRSADQHTPLKRVHHLELNVRQTNFNLRGTISHAVHSDGSDLVIDGWSKSSSNKIIPPRRTIQHSSQTTAVSNQSAPNNQPLPTLSLQEIEGVETFVFFIGYPRSGHSIVGSMIDAHPSAIMAHESNLFANLVKNLTKQNLFLRSKANVYNSLYQNSYKQVVSGWRSSNSRYTRKGYTLKLNTTQSWQGRFNRLKVIGDKSGGSTARAYNDNPMMFKNVYKSLSELIKVPIRVIHVVRNPFDMIATRLLIRFGFPKGHKANFTETHKLSNTKFIQQAVNGLYNEAKAVNDMVEDCGLTQLEIHNVDFIRNPKREMKRVCDFVGLECSEGFLQMCEDGTFKNLSKTRNVIEWKPEVKRSVDKMITSFPFFRRYSLSSD